MTQLEQYQKIQHQYQAILDQTYADLSNNLTEISGILDSLKIPAITIHQKNEKEPDTPALEITFSSGSGRQGKQIYFSQTGTTTQSGLNTLIRSPELFEFVCRTWILHKEEILKSINHQLKKEIQLKKDYIECHKQNLTNSTKNSSPLPRKN